MHGGGGGGGGGGWLVTGGNYSLGTNLNDMAWNRQVVGYRQVLLYLLYSRAERRSCNFRAGSQEEQYSTGPADVCCTHVTVVQKG